jgi:hypothetical protein
MKKVKPQHTKKEVIEWKSMDSAPKDGTRILVDCWQSHMGMTTREVYWGKFKNGEGWRSVPFPPSEIYRWAKLPVSSYSNTTKFVWWLERHTPKYLPALNGWYFGHKRITLRNILTQWGKIKW